MMCVYIALAQEMTSIFNTKITPKQKTFLNILRKIKNVFKQIVVQNLMLKKYIYSYFPRFLLT